MRCEEALDTTPPLRRFVQSHPLQTRQILSSLAIYTSWHLSLGGQQIPCEGGGKNKVVDALSYNIDRQLE